MRKNIFLLALLFFVGLGTTLSAQGNNAYRVSKDSDPAAVKIVYALRKQYDSYTTIKAAFRLDIEFPGQAVETQTGELSRSGDLFHFKLGKQEGISDGKALYAILRARKAMQVSKLPEPGEDGGMITPQTLFSFYDQGNYILALQGEETEKGRVRQVIEMKPENRDESEFTKLRMVIDKKTQTVVRLLAFSRDGSRFTFHLDSTVPNAPMNAADFVFKKDNYPGYYVEDLRF